MTTVYLPLPDSLQFISAEHQGRIPECRGPVCFLCAQEYENYTDGKESAEESATARENFPSAKPIYGLYACGGDYPYADTSWFSAKRRSRERDWPCSMGGLGFQFLLDGRRNGVPPTPEGGCVVE